MLKIFNALAIPTTELPLLEANLCWCLFTFKRSLRYARTNRTLTS
jgi:hypothetical protein